MFEPREMLAAFYERKGRARDVFVVATLPVPRPRPHDVVVRLAVSGVNPSDVKSRNGRISMEMPFPYVIPHSDGAGVIAAVGAGVDAHRVGDRVWVYNAQWQRPHGTAAQYVVLPASQAVRLPDDVDFETGACLGIPAQTAHRAVHIDGSVAGKTVLVTGGAGAVGRYAIQFAKAAGASVLTTVSSAAKADAARHAGADVIIDYTTEDVAASIRAATGRSHVDRVIEVDMAANAGLYPSIIAKGGTIVCYGSGVDDVALPVRMFRQSDVTLRFFLVYQLPLAARRAAISDISKMLKQRALSHAIAARFPIAGIAEAHDAVEAGLASGGNVVVQLPEQIP